MADTTTLGILLADLSGWGATLSHLAAGAIGGAVSGAFLNHYFQRRRYFQEQLMARYSELVGLATAEIDRAKSVEATFAVGPADDDATKQHLARLFNERDSIRRDLTRVAFQIQLLESDPTLAAQVKRLAATQPFLLPGRWHQGDFNDRFEKYVQDIADFVKLLEAVRDGVVKKRALL